MALNPLRRVIPAGINVDDILRNLPNSAVLSERGAPRTIAPLPNVPIPDVSTERVELDSRSQPPSRQVVPPEELGTPPTLFKRNNKGRPVGIDVGPTDPIEQNIELIREQENYKAPRSTKDQILSLFTGGVPGAIDYATNQNTRNRWAVGEDVAREEGQIDRELGLQGKQASIAAAKQRPVFQQQNQDLKQDAQDEREINNALSQWNKIEYYDPDDPDYASLREYFRAHKVDPPKKLKGSNQVLVWRNGKTELIDKSTAEARPTTLNGQASPADVSRTPNAQGLIPNQQVRVTEGEKNRAARAAITDKLIKAIAGRQDKQIAATIAQLGDPQEMYGAASDLWSQAQEAESQANSMEIKTEADVATKKQLLENAAKLKETTVKIQQEARKAARGQRATSGSKPKKMGLSRAIFRTNNPSLKDKSDAEIDALIIGGGYAPLP